MANNITPGSAQDAFLITPSDTVDVKLDANNLKLYPTVYVHNATATGGQVRVLPADGGKDNNTPVTVYIPAGATCELAVRRIYATSPAPPATLTAFITKQ